MEEKAAGSIPLSCSRRTSAQVSLKPRSSGRKGGGVGKGIEGIGAIEYLAVPGEEPIAIGLVGRGFELPVDLFEPGGVVRGESPLDGFLVGGVGEGEHGAPGMPDDCGGFGGDGGEVVDGAGSAGSAVQQDDRGTAGGIVTPCAHLHSGIVGAAVKADFDRFAVHGELRCRGAARDAGTDVTGVWICGKIGWGRRI
jgi:hypothetical protein